MLAVSCPYLDPINDTNIRTEITIFPFVIAFT